MKVLLALLLMAVLLSFGFVHAIPSVSDVQGTIMHAESLTILGSGFLQKNPVEPYLWQDWEDVGAVEGATVEDSVGVHGWFERSPTYTPPITFRTKSYGPGSYSAMNIHPYGGGDPEATDHALVHQVVAELDSFIYLNVHSTMPPTCGSGDPSLHPPCIRIWKYMRLLNVQYNYPSFRVFNDANNRSSFDLAGGSEGSGWSAAANRGWAGGDDEWHQLEFDLWTGSADTSNARSRGGFDGYINDRSTELGLLDSNDPSNYWVPGEPLYNWLQLDGGMHNDLSWLSEPYEVYWDNIYVDNTPSRVVIGNAATYSACTVRDPQPPTAWADNSITVDVNQGSFDLGEQAWIYVVDSNGDYNENGYEITIGDSSTPFQDHYLDFDSSTNTYTESGYISVLASAYNPTDAYGWVGTVPNEYVTSDLTNPAYKIAHQESLMRDCHYRNGPGEFVVDVPNGYYQVSMGVVALEEIGNTFLTNFDIEGHYFLQNNLRVSITTWDRDRWFKTPVEVSDGQLNIGFESETLLCGLKIEKVSRPTISTLTGSISHNSVLTIDGNNFGYKAHPEPLLWDDFEDGIVPNQLDSSPKWDPRTDFPVVNYVNYPYSGNLAVWNQDGSDFESATFNFAETEVVYNNYRYRYELGAEGMTGIQKPNRISSINVYGGSAYNGAGTAEYSDTFTSVTPNNVVDDYYGIVSVGHPVADTWLMMELYKVVSTPGGYDGVLQVTFDGVPVTNDWDLLTRESICILPDCTSNCEVTCDWEQNVLLLGTMWSNGPTQEQPRIYIDDVYLDDTYARVMLCDTNNFADVTSPAASPKCEMQIPQNIWAAGQIEIKVNQGAFADTDTVWLYVIDEDGAVSEGFGPLTFDSRPPVCNNDGICDEPLEDFNNCPSDCPDDIPKVNPYDLDGDTDVDFDDLFELASNYGATTSVNDFSNDGRINILDLLILINNFT